MERFGKDGNITSNAKNNLLQKSLGHVIRTMKYECLSLQGLIEGKKDKKTKIP